MEKKEKAEVPWCCHTLLESKLKHTAEPHAPSQSRGLNRLNNICLPFSLAVSDGRKHMQSDGEPLSWSWVCLLCMWTRITNYSSLCMIFLAAHGLVFLSLSRCGPHDVGHLQFVFKVKVLMHEWCLEGLVLLSYDEHCQLVKLIFNKDFTLDENNDCFHSWQNNKQEVVNCLTGNSNTVLSLRVWYRDTSASSWMLCSFSGW